MVKVGNWIKVRWRHRNTRRFLVFVQMALPALVFYLSYTSGIFRIYGVSGCLFMIGLAAWDLLIDKRQPCYCRCNCNSNPRSGT